MKNQTFISFMALLLLASVSFIGCDNDGGGVSSQDTQALTENDFAGDPFLRADPEKHLLVYFLEHPGSDNPGNDTGGVGNDTIPYTYTRTLNHTLCWEDDDADAEHFMELEDSDGNEIFRLDVNGECITVVLEAGDYKMIIFHDGRIEETLPIFIIPELNGDLEAKKEETIPEGILGRAGRILSNVLEKLDISITQITNAQSLEDNRITLLNTNSCVGCDLAEADLREADLREVDLTQANLTQADLSGATWCDGCICAQKVSIGTCVGCASIDTCKGS